MFTKRQKLNDLQYYFIIYFKIYQNQITIMRFEQQTLVFLIIYYKFRLI